MAIPYDCNEGTKIIEYSPKYSYSWLMRHEKSSNEQDFD